MDFLDLVILLQYSKYRDVLAYLTQILSYSILPKRSILFDAQACSSKIIRISLHMTSHVVFAQGQFLRNFVVCFQWPVCLWQSRVTIPGLHILIKILPVRIIPIFKDRPGRRFSQWEAAFRFTYRVSKQTSIFKMVDYGGQRWVERWFPDILLSDYAYFWTYMWGYENIFLSKRSS